MNKKNGLSIMGYGIVFVIILGIIMIISAPMLVNSNSKSANKSESEPEPERRKYEDEYIPQENSSELRQLEEQLSSRIDNLERNMNSRNNNNSVSDKYVCTIEGTLNENGDVVPVDSVDRSGKIVFVCEYRR